MKMKIDVLRNGVCGDQDQIAQEQRQRTPDIHIVRDNMASMCGFKPKRWWQFLADGPTCQDCISKLKKERGEL